MKIVKLFKQSGFLIKGGISESIKKGAGEQKGGIVSTLFTIFGTSSLENLLWDKGTIRAGEGRIRVVGSIKVLSKGTQI